MHVKVSSEQDVINAVSAANETFGRLDVAVNCAGKIPQ